MFDINTRKFEKFKREFLKTDLQPNDIIRYSHISKNSNIKFAKDLNLLIEEIVVLLGSLDKKNQNVFLDEYKPYLYANLPDIIDFENLDQLKCMSVVYLSRLLVDSSPEVIKKSISQNIKTSELLKIYPEFEEKVDNDSQLLLIDDTTILTKWGIEYKEHFIPYHQLLRRNYIGRVNSDFIWEFNTLYKKKRNENTFYIAVDFNRITKRDNLQGVIECDSWYGVPYSDKKIDDKNNVGLTVINRTENANNIYPINISRSEFFWSYNSQIKNFCSEEITKYKAGYYLNRYFHSQRNINQKKFIHVDGKINVYESGSYNQRIDSHFPDEFKPKKSIKLFRIDGNISTEEWSELFSKFYKGNEMVLQYLDPNFFKSE